MNDKELIAKMIQGTLTKDEYARLKELVNSMSDEQITQFIDSSLEDEHVEIPAGAFDRVRRNIHDEIRHTLWRSRLLKWTAVAAMIVVPLLLAGTIYFYNRSARFDDYSKMLSSVTQIATGEDESLTVVLPDGTKSFMEPMSTISYTMSEFSDLSRTIDFNGDAFFEVIHRDNAPFIINTEAMTVTVKGTSFLVSAHDGAETAAVYLESGVVEVSSKMSGKSLTLSQGQYVSLDCRNGTFTLSDADNRNDAAAMARGDMIFHDIAMRDVIDNVQKRYGVNIRIARSAMLDRHFTGYIPSNNLEIALDIISTSLNSTATIENTPH